MSAGPIAVVISGARDGYSLPTTGGGGGGSSQIEGRAANGAAPVGNPVWCSGSDGAAIRALLTDTSGRQQIVGAAASGAAVAGNPVLAGGSDGANARSLLTDTSGRQQIVGAAAGGAAVAGNPVLVGLSDGANARSALSDTSGRLQVIGGAASGAAPAGNPVLIGGSDGTNVQIPRLTTAGDAATIAQPGLNTNAVGYAFNETTYDRLRPNTTGTALASAARTATTNSADFVNYNGKGISATINVTVASGTGGLVLSVQSQDPVTATYYAVATSGGALLTTGFRVYEVYPGIGTAGGGVTQRFSASLPRPFRISVAHGDASSYTYSVGFLLVL